MVWTPILAWLTFNGGFDEGVTAPFSFCWTRYSFQSSVSTYQFLPILNAGISPAVDKRLSVWTASPDWVPNWLRVNKLIV